MTMFDLIIRKAQACGIAMSEVQAGKFEMYHKMLTERNRQTNLTAVPEDIEEAIDRNYLDCISVLKFESLKDIQTAIDVGSGAGFPGIPLSIMCPWIRFTLMDSLGKRVDFLNEVIDALDLNAAAVHMRAEDGAVKPELRESFDLATARAVAAVNVLSEYLLPFVRIGGTMLVYKGPNLSAEMEEAENAIRTLGGVPLRTYDVSIPGRDWEHKLALIEKRTVTPARYPRRAGKPEKKPL